MRDDGIETMDDLNSLIRVLEVLLKEGVNTWRPEEARAVLRAGRALAREQGRPGLFDRLLAERMAGSHQAVA
jgi:hypothetical protein